MIETAFGPVESDEEAKVSNLRGKMIAKAEYLDNNVCGDERIELTFTDGSRIVIGTSEYLAVDFFSRNERVIQHKPQNLSSNLS